MSSVAIKGSSVMTGHGCDAITTLAAPGQGSVYIGGQLIARLNDLTEQHEIQQGFSCVPHTAPITSSSSSVYVSGLPVARQGDSCDQGSITSGNGAGVFCN